MPPSAHPQADRSAGGSLGQLRRRPGSRVAASRSASRSGSAVGLATGGFIALRTAGGSEMRSTGACRPSDEA